MKKHYFFMGYKDGRYYISVYRHEGGPYPLTAMDVVYYLSRKMPYEQIEKAMELAKTFRYLPKGVRISYGYNF